MLLDRKKGIDPLLRWNLFSYSWDKYEFHQIYSKKFRWNGQVVAILSDRFWKAPTDGNLKYSRPVNHIHVRMASGNVRDVRVKISKIRDISVGDYVTFVGKLDSFPKNNFFTSLNKFRYINPWKDPLAESTIPHMFQFQVLGIQVKKIHPPASNSQPNVSSSPPLIAPTLIPYVFLMVFLPLVNNINILSNLI